MTCFWDGLCAALKGAALLDQGTSASELARFLKANNALTPGVRWNGQPLAGAALEENYLHVAAWDVSTAPDGYDCSSTDPFMMLVCDVFAVDVEHQLGDHVFRYTCGRPAAPVLRFGYSPGHMYVA
jgi:hypothetical protein